SPGTLASSISLGICFSKSAIRVFQGTPSSDSADSGFPPVTDEASERWVSRPLPAITIPTPRKKSRAILSLRGSMGFNTPSVLAVTRAEMPAAAATRPPAPSNPARNAEGISAHHQQIELLAHFGQQLPPSRQRLTQQATTRVIK